MTKNRVEQPSRDRLDQLFRQLRWGSIVAPLVLVAVIEATGWAASPLVSPWALRLLLVAAVIVVIVVLSDQAFRRLRALQQRLLHQNRELLALHDASLTVVADLSLDSVLETIVEKARELIGTKYGAVSVIDDHARVISFVSAGLDEATQRRIGPPPEGRGLLGVPLREGQHLRIDAVRDDRRSVGFPEHHPEMRSLLAVPILCTVPHRGNLYLSEKNDNSPFTAEDEETLVRFANQAAIGIDNAYLHRQVRELAAARERMYMAHEMHDGVAQVLAFVNTKSQVVGEYLRQGKPDEARSHLQQLEEAAREIYADVRAQILDLRTSMPGDKGLLQALEEYTAKWQSHAAVPLELTLPPKLDLRVDAELQVLRIIQEALANVRKHAEAKSVRVVVAIDDSHLTAEVTDDGIGFDDGLSIRSLNPRFGLATMRERAQALGAEFRVESAPGAGTRVCLSLPLTARAKEHATDATSHR